MRRNNVSTLQNLLSRTIRLICKKNRLDVVSCTPRVYSSRRVLFFGNSTKGLTLNRTIITSIIDKASQFETIDSNKRLSPLISTLLTFVTVHPLLMRILTPLGENSLHSVCAQEIRVPLALFAFGTITFFVESKLVTPMSFVETAHRTMTLILVP